MPSTYCYTDESGQHTAGELFIVSSVLAGYERDALRSACEWIEARTGKRAKWTKTSSEIRLAYIREVLSLPLLHGRLCYGVYHGLLDYPDATARAIAAAINSSNFANQHVIVTIDGLRKSEKQSTAITLRRLSVKLRDVRGARDESESLIRLADSVCGLILAANKDRPILKELFERAVKTGFLRDVSGG